HIGPTRCAILLSAETAGTGASLATRLAGELRAPILCEGVPMTLSPAIGVHDFAAGSETPPAMLRRLFSAAEDARANETSFAVSSRQHDERYTRSFLL